MTSSLARRSSIEPLEDRIAPALLVNGANLLGGAGNPSSGETSVGDNSVTLVKVLSGQALVWYDDGAILSISFGPNTSMEIHGNIYGDVVGNLTSAGLLSDSDNNPANGEDGGVLLANNLTGLKTFSLGTQDGSLDSIITGGSISGLTINGEIYGAYAGDGVFRSESYRVSAGHVLSTVGTLDINPVESGVQSTFDFNKASPLNTYVAGASIKTAKITKAMALQMFAGSGNPTGATFATTAGPVGGSISGITIENALIPASAPTDTPSYWFLAGDGANGKTGGAGGSITSIIEKSSYGSVIMTAGAGGSGAGGAGGVGGSISSLDVQSNSSHYIVTAGNGGNGAPAGDGGKLMNNNFSNRTPVSGIIVSADFTGDGIDDILVVDASTGQMIISTQDDSNPKDGIPEGTTSTFKQLVQYTNLGGDDVVLITPNGTSPSDAMAMDINGDGLKDIVVAYKGSNSLGVFLNKGDGVFFDPNLGTDGEFATTSLGLSFSPVKMATNGNIIALAENADGKGVMHYGRPEGLSVDDLTFELATGKNEFAQAITDIVFAGDQFYTGFSDGVLSKLAPAAMDAKKAFVVTNTSVAIVGGISDLELDSTGKRLLALSQTGHTLDVFDITGSAVTPLSTLALSPTASPLVAHFVKDADLTTEDEITVLALLTAGSTFTTFTPAATDGNAATFEPYSVTTSATVSTVLKNFVPLYSGSTFIGDAALAGSMNSFLVTADLVSATEYPLPFASKIIEATAGDGGNGINIGKTLGKGGAGGSIAGINADANEIRLIAGTGGSSLGGAGGAGGSVTNPGTFTTASLVTLTPALNADVLLEIEAGNGGTPTGTPAKTAIGGVGGSLTGLKITLDAGDITLTTGNGGNGNGGAGGAGGSFNSVTTIAHDGNLTLSTGLGGNALTGTGAVGGAGGSINNFSHELSLDSNIELLEKAYSVNITTGNGGFSAAGIGGAGGSLNGVALSLDGSNITYNNSSVTPPMVDSNKDNTVRVAVTTGNGGLGASGGAGGSIKNFSHTSVFDQRTPSGNVLVNYVVMQLTAGDGGAGTAGTGGAGGTIALVKPISGITQFDLDANDPADPVSRVPFIATAGDGGNGTLKGGAGGAITGLTLQNAQFADGASITRTHLESAIITAGNGGNGGTSDGGVGGNVSGLLIGTQAGNLRVTSNVLEGGFLTVTAGNGGNGGTSGKGGAGGGVLTSTFGVVNSVADVGLTVRAGSGGNGTLAGGVGGILSGIQVSTPQSTSGISALLYAGDGGAANSAAGIGGKGGDVLNLSQGKDVNSSINLIEAGNGGGNALGKGGAGGNVTGVKTVGFIGRPSDGADRLGVFDTIGSGPGAIEFAQGVYSGRGGDGLTDGIAGAVTNVTARQIAAIAAAVDSNGLFAAASKIATIKASVIGFDIDQDSTFDSTVPGTPKPSLSKPVDGFIFSATPLTAVATLPGSSFVFIG